MKLPKPPRRGPKPPKRLPRATKPIARKSRVRKAKKTSRGKMGRTADKLFSLIVRARGKCLEHAVALRGCAGPLQTAHVVSRTYRSVRWSEDNAFCLCAGAHVFYTHHPIHWENFVTGQIGADTYADLKRRAMEHWDGDLESVLVRLAAKATALGIIPEGKEKAA